MSEWTGVAWAGCGWPAQWDDCSTYSFLPPRPWTLAGSPSKPYQLNIKYPSNFIYIYISLICKRKLTARKLISNMEFIRTVAMHRSLGYNHLDCLIESVTRIYCTYSASISVQALHPKWHSQGVGEIVFRLLDIQSTSTAIGLRKHRIPSDLRS